jgi:hypothetical protein
MVSSRVMAKIIKADWAAPLEGLRVGVFQPAAQHVDDLVDRPDAHIPRVLVLPHTIMLFSTPGNSLILLLIPAGKQGCLHLFYLPFVHVQSVGKKQSSCALTGEGLRRKEGSGKRLNTAAHLIVHMSHDLLQGLFAEAGSEQEPLSLVQGPPQHILDPGMRVVQVC